MNFNSIKILLDKVWSMLLGIGWDKPTAKANNPQISPSSTMMACAFLLLETLQECKRSSSIPPRINP